MTNSQLVCADLDANGVVNNDDAILLQKYYSQQINTFPAGDSGTTRTSNVTINNWYDYSGKKWANAVLVNSTNRSTYNSATAGTVIAEDDILAFYVWIPRFKYKVWNINKEAGVDSYDAENSGIDIVFEDGTSTTGSISCTYNFAAGSDTNAESCTGTNDSYYTHPAFTFGSDELSGFWIGKFELSSETPAATNGGGVSITLTPRVLPNVASWRYNTLSNFWRVIYNMQATNNIYGLPTSRTNVDSHMITDMEWGAVAYLTHSKYGRCTDGTCTEISVNNCSNFITGIGAYTANANSSTTTCTTDDNKYNGEYGVKASTTRNVTGVYDMSGGSGEFVMSNVSSSNSEFSYNVNQAGTAFTYSTETSKYLTQYAYYPKKSGRLGDANYEIMKNSNSRISWNGDYSMSHNLWSVRGGTANCRFINGTGASVGSCSYNGIFYSYPHNGIYNASVSTRPVLTYTSS